jgi:hypothetical protein
LHPSKIAPRELMLRPRIPRNSYQYILYVIFICMA